MNIFFPDVSCIESVRSLDDKRLNKQILECYQIYQVYLGVSEGYKNHPITKHYIQFPSIISIYGFAACIEYKFRTGKYHKYNDYFKDAFNQYKDDDTEYVLFYAEGSKSSPNCIRTTDIYEVTKLYKQKLVNKWDSDIEKGRPPKWTNREAPEWYNLDKGD